MTDKDSNFYYVEGKPFVRVTHVISTVLNKPTLNTWRAKIGHDAAEDWTEETAAIGSEVHRITQEIDEGYSFNDAPGGKVHWSLLDDRIKNGIKSYLMAKETLKFKPVRSEVFVVSHEYGYAGTADLFCEYDSGRWLLDKKVSSSLWPEVHYQLAAYWNAWHENGHTTLDGCMALRLNRDTGLWTPDDKLVMTPLDLEFHFGLFLGFLKAWRHEYEGN